MIVTSKLPWARILIFYTIAFSISGVFNSGLFTPLYKKLSEGLLIENWSFLPAGIGTLIAAFIAARLDKKRIITITLLGNHYLKNILITIVPIIVFTIIGIENETNVNKNVYALAFSIIALIYAVTEEIFWRSYLLDTLRPLGKLLYSLTIGILWWAWHFRFSTMFDFTGFLFICVISSFLLCQFANETKSFLTAAGLHSLIIVTTSNGEITKSKIMGTGISILIWLSVGIFWKAKELSV
jgi:uncharacterized protein